MNNNVVSLKKPNLNALVQEALKNSQIFILSFSETQDDYNEEFYLFDSNQTNKDEIQKLYEHYQLTLGEEENPNFLPFDEWLSNKNICCEKLQAPQIAMINSGCYGLKRSM